MSAVNQSKMKIHASLHYIADGIPEEALAQVFRLFAQRRLMAQANVQSGDEKYVVDEILRINELIKELLILPDATSK